MFAGRNISATHVAFGSTRVMATCAVLGEAAGTGAALAVSRGVTPRDIYRRHLKELQQTLLKADASLIGVRNEDPRDLARTASVTASGWRRRIVVDERDDRVLLKHDLGVIVPVDPEIREFRLLVDAEEDTTLEAELWRPLKPQNYIPEEWVAADRAAVNKGRQQWVSFQLPWKPERPQNAFVIVKANPSVRVYVSGRTHSGTLTLANTGEARAEKKLEDHDTSQLLVKWSAKPFQYRSACFAVEPETDAFAPHKVIDGYRRPYGGPHMWNSEPITPGSGSPWLQLEWDGERRIGEIHLVFNDDVQKDLINLHHHRTPFEIMPELVKDYRVEARIGGTWETVVRETGNRKRKRVHRLDRPIRTDRIRLVVEATNGSPYAEVIEVRVYE